MSTPRPIDVATLTREQWDIFTAGYTSGLAAGLQRARDLNDSQSRAAHTTAGRIVAGMSRSDPRPGTEHLMTETSDELTQRAIDRERAKALEVQADNRAYRATHQHQAAS